MDRKFAQTLRWQNGQKRRRQGRQKTPRQERTTGLFDSQSIYTTDRKEDFITIKDFQRQFGEVKFKDSRIHWSGKIAYIVTGNQWAKQPKRLLDAAAYKQFKEDLKALRDKKDARQISERDYAAEARKHGKQIIRFTSLDYIEPNRDKWLEVPDEVQSSYRHDRNRGGVDLFKDKFLTRDQLERRNNPLPLLDGRRASHGFWARAMLPNSLRKFNRRRRENFGQRRD